MKMKMILCCLLFSAMTANAATTDDELKTLLVGLEKDSWVAWKNRDGSYFEHFLSDDHLEISPQGVAGKALVVKFVNSPACVVKSYEVDTFALTRVDENTAILTYRSKQDTLCNGVTVPSPAWATSLFVRRGGRWQNLLYQHTWGCPPPAK